MNVKKRENIVQQVDVMRVRILFIIAVVVAIIIIIIIIITLL